MLYAAEMLVGLIVLYLLVAVIGTQKLGLNIPVPEVHRVRAAEVRYVTRAGNPLYIAKGNAIYQLQDPIGFGRDAER